MKLYCNPSSDTFLNMNFKKHSWMILNGLQMLDLASNAKRKYGGWVNLCRSNSHAGVLQSFKWPDNRPYLNSGVAEQLQDVGYTVWLIVGMWPGVQCVSENCFFFIGGGGYGIRHVYQDGFVFILYAILM